MERDMLQQPSSPVANAPEPSSASASDPIVTALETKRKQLDAEILAFKTLKDKEYAGYERQLRSTNTPPSPSFPVESNVSVEANSMSSVVNHAPLFASPSSGSTTPEISERSRITHRRTNSNDRRLGRQSRSAQQALMQAFSGSAVSRTSSEERSEGSQTETQREWEGVFTPDYLSLIDGRGTRPSTAQQSSSMTGNPPTNSLTDESTQVAASGPTPSPTTSSHLQHPPQHLSSSAPACSPTHSRTLPSLGLTPHNRSDSTNSVLSASSLRSSMKDPKQPKSPKRVLFSIDDGLVVSPSTSPTLSRKASGSASSEERGNGTANIDVGGDSCASLGGGVESILDFGIGKPRAKRKNRRKERSQGSEDRGRGRDAAGLEAFGVSEGRGFTDLVKGWETPFSAGDAAAAQGSASGTGMGITGGSSGLGKKGSVLKGFGTDNDEGNGAKIEDDELFAFDEEIDGSDRGGKGKPVDEAGMGETDHIDDDEPEAENGLPGTSPHAGSLPIEIKWPRRREILDDG